MSDPDGGSTSATLDPFILQYAPGPVAALHPALLAARQQIRGLIAAFAKLPDSSLRIAWHWGDNEVDVRYAFYRALESLESATGAVQLAMAPAPSSEAREAVGAATLARWQLQGVLATLKDADLDADPGNGEWTVRQTVAHIIGSQRGYSWGSAWWLFVRDQPRAPGEQRAPEEVFADLPDENEEATGHLVNVRRQVDEIVDSTSSRYAMLTDEDLTVKAGWSGMPVTVGFRQWRWSSHIAEHTVQVEKTLDMIHRPLSEVDRLVRVVAGAFGRLEAVVFYRAVTPGAAETLESVASQLAEIDQTLTPALAAGKPATIEW